MTKVRRDSFEQLLSSYIEENRQRYVWEGASMKDKECIKCEKMFECKYDKPKGVLCLHFQERKNEQQHNAEH